MSMTQSQPRGGYLDRPHSSSLADVLNVILDKGLVIDAYIRVSLVGIEILTIDARIVIASVDTYLRFAEATHRLDLQAQGGKGLPEMIEGRREDQDDSAGARNAQLGERRRPQGGTPPTAAAALTDRPGATPPHRLGTTSAIRPPVHGKQGTEEDP